LAFFLEQVLLFDFSAVYKRNNTTGSMTVKICFNDETIYAAFDQTVKLIKNSNINYTRVSIKEFSYYGTEVQFDIYPAK